MADRIRIVVAGPGPGDDDRNAEVVARALRDAGMEVVYTGVQTPEQLVATVVQEDADAVGLSGADEPVLRRMRELLDDLDATDVVVFGDGTGSPDDVVEWVRRNVTTVEPADTG